MVTRSSILQAVNLPKEIRQRQSVKKEQQAVRSVSSAKTRHTMYVSVPTRRFLERHTTQDGAV